MTQIKDALTRSPATLAQDFLGALALVASMVIALHLPGLF